MWWEKSNTTSFRNLAASFADLALALDKAVNDGSIDKNNATVLDWNKAADSMSDYLGLKGDYTYTTDKSKIGLSDATIIQLRGSSGVGSHFVNDIGSGKYYDPWTNQTGNISDIENRIVGYRYLDYK